MSSRIFFMHNAQSAPFNNLPLLSFDDFKEEVLSQVSQGSRISAWFGIPMDNGSVQLIAVLARDEIGDLGLTSTVVKASYRSLTPDCPQLHLFEREFFEQWNVRPDGHPWLKSVRFPLESHCADFTGPVLEPYQIKGEKVHEVAVGPVHAGVIEPGHFRFQCHGENVHHLEISLGYQHRGIERVLSGPRSNRTTHYMETASGDTTIAHMTAYSQVVESLCGTRVPPGAEIIRGIALELERLACHTGDLGALAGDVGFLPTASFCGRIRGEFLNMTALLCGNRFGRGLVTPGGVKWDLDADRSRLLSERLEKNFRDVKHAVNLLWETPSVMARFENTGVITPKTAKELGLVGPACRACGIERDVRFQFSQGIFSTHHVPVATGSTGDVFARAYVRWKEICRSYEFLKSLLTGPIAGELWAKPEKMDSDRIAVSLVEGWRGEICHVAVSDQKGDFRAYKIIDSSFHNWQGLAMSLRGEEISDFPICNKSFNLSYCGHDL